MLLSLTGRCVVGMQELGFARLLPWMSELPWMC